MVNIWIIYISGWWLRFLPLLKNMTKRQLGWWHSQYMGKWKNVPNHQPGDQYDQWNMIQHGPTPNTSLITGGDDVAVEPAGTLSGSPVDGSRVSFSLLGRCGEPQSSCQAYTTPQPDQRSEASMPVALPKWVWVVNWHNFQVSTCSDDYHWLEEWLQWW